MARLPTSGSDSGTWGDVLNTFLQVGPAAAGTNIGGVVETLQHRGRTQAADAHGQPGDFGRLAEVIAEFNLGREDYNRAVIDVLHLALRPEYDTKMSVGGIELSVRNVMTDADMQAVLTRRGV